MTTSNLLVLSATLLASSNALSSMRMSLGGLPSWKDLEAKLPSLRHAGPAIYDTTVSGPVDDANLKGKLAVYVDRNHWCPNTQSALLALEVKNAEYVKVLVDNDYTEPNTLPRVQWPDGTVQEGKDMYDILEKIQKECPDGPDLYPQDISVSVDIVRASIERRFDGIMPRYTEPSSVAPFIFRDEQFREHEGEVVPKFKFQVSLEEVDEVLEEYDDGPYIAGKGITAADIYWIPYLERFAAQLPLIYEGLEPRSREYEALKEFYDAMDEHVPCYSCKVKGRVQTWQHVLEKFHPHMELRKNVVVPDLPTRPSFDANKVWAKFAEGKEYVASSPMLEAAAQIVRNHAELVDAAKAACQSISDEDAADAALRELCGVLASIERFDPDAASEAASKLSGNARDVASFLVSEDGLAVPRDIGLIPSEALHALVIAAPKPRIF
mmetsp:Transcript_32335/g.71415  ORF Transcript_32335/g.71415 Transcript_32335/m.71415 type:complete len:438 (-) Transcript_32335:68-1381(-)